MRRLIAMAATILMASTLFLQWQGPLRTSAAEAVALPAGTLPAEALQQGPCLIPTDVTAKLSAGYGRAIDAKDQQPFDEFSWQTFLAVNCPATINGPQQTPAQYDNIPRIWENWVNAEDLLIPNQGNPSCASATSGTSAKIMRRISKNPHIKSSMIKKPGASILEAVGGPLIDRNEDFTLYEIHLNPDEVGYIKANNLQTLGGQFAFKQSGKTVSFPAGPTTQFGNEGAIEVKAAWRILDPSKGDKPERFYTRLAMIYVDRADTQNGQPLCFQAIIGLVGLHIIHKTKNFNRWIWSTFEHIDNVPNGPGQPPYSYNDPNCLSGDCYPPNTAPPAQKNGFKWAATAPYAKAYSPDGVHGTQVYRSVPIYAETEQVNQTWRSRIAGSVWANYHLIGSQWSVPLDQPFPQPVISIPAVLGNTTLETYIQPTANCIGCHGFAQTAVGQKSDLSFVLGMVPLLKSKTSATKQSVKK